MRERRERKGMNKAIERRKEVSEYLKAERAAKEKAWREGKNVELPGKKSKSTKERYAEQNDKGGIIIPLAPFGTSCRVGRRMCCVGTVSVDPPR